MSYTRLPMHLFLGAVALLAIAVAVGIVTAFLIAKMKEDASHGTSGTLSSAMLQVQSLLEPEKQRMAETVREDREEERDGSSDPGSSG
jgi:hypothetical protein